MGCFEFLPQRRDSEWRNKKHFVDSDSLEEVEKSKPVTPLEGTPESDVVVEVLTASEPAAVGSVGTKLTQSGSLRKPKDLRDFSYLELKQATKNFHRQNLLGEGGFGQVFKGCIKHKSKFAGEEKVDVAVKQLNSRGQQGHKEWLAEVHFLGLVDCPYLVKLIGYCANDEDERGIQRLLVYEYMPNKGLDDHLFQLGSNPLSWQSRVKIALGAARGLAYLHEEMEIQVIFRDFKTSNVLLDEDFNPKLSDFGLARQGPQEGNSHVSTAIVGTAGYAAPEYIQTGHLTSKSDVWSFGVVMLEMLTGRRVMDRNRPKNEQRLFEWVKPYINDSQKFWQIVDPQLDGKYPLRPAVKFAQLATNCLQKFPKNRPKMSEVVERLRMVLERTYLWEAPQSPARAIGEGVKTLRVPELSKPSKDGPKAPMLGSLPPVESGKVLNMSPKPTPSSQVSDEIAPAPKHVYELSIDTSNISLETSTAENSPAQVGPKKSRRSWASDRLSRRSRESGRFTWIPKLSFSST